MASLALCLAAYLAIAAPSSWFPGVSASSWSAQDLRVATGAMEVVKDELVVHAVDPSSATALITVTTDIRAADYPAIAWTATGVPDNAQVQLIWRTDYAPARINALPVGVASGRLLPVLAASDRNWIGRITGLGLLIRGPLQQPVRIRGVVAKPMGVAAILSDRAHEWIAFEPWSGSSINTLVGGADVQDLPLPPLAALAALVGALLWYAWAWRARTTHALPAVIATLFFAAWMLVDARWTWNLARQVRETGTQYAGKDWRERRLAAEDGALFAFIEKVRTKLPPQPARVFVAADAHYFRGRGAYHLYPHNVFFDPYLNTIPPPTAMHAGDYVVVYHRHGVQYDPSQKRLRWDGGAPVAAELLLAESGAALFKLI